MNQFLRVGIILGILSLTCLVAALLLMGFHAIMMRLRRRSKLVATFRRNLRATVYERIHEDIEQNQPWAWRFKAFYQVSFRRMVWSRKQLNPENFYKDTAFLKSLTQTTERKPMYLLMAYIGGSWGIAGVDPHEEHAVLFIEQIDKQFGEGTAFVVKLPDKSHEDHTTEFQKLADLAGMLKDIESGDFDFDTAFTELNDKFKNGKFKNES